MEAQETLAGIGEGIVHVRLDRGTSAFSIEVYGDSRDGRNAPALVTYGGSVDVDRDLFLTMLRNGGAVAALVAREGEDRAMEILGDAAGRIVLPDDGDEPA